MQLGSKRVSNFCVIHNSPEKQTLSRGWLLKDVDSVDFLRMAMWFIKIKHTPLPLPPLFSHLCCTPTSPPASHSFPFAFFSHTLLEISVPSLPLLSPIPLPLILSPPLCTFPTLIQLSPCLLWFLCACLSDSPPPPAPCVSLSFCNSPHPPCFSSLSHSIYRLSVSVFPCLSSTRPCCLFLLWTPQLLALLPTRSLWGHASGRACGGPCCISKRPRHSRHSHYSHFPSDLLPEDPGDAGLWWGGN